MKNILMTLTAVVAASLMLACSSGGRKSAAPGPEDVVTAFNRAISAGDFSQAKQLCDTVLMNSYLESYVATWQTICDKDSAALAIASSVLSDADIEICGNQKEGDKRMITYTVRLDGYLKTKTATLRNEEGEWKVERITDAS